LKKTKFIVLLFFVSVLHEVDVHDRGGFAGHCDNRSRHVGEVQPAGISDHEGRSLRQPGNKFLSTQFLY
jgi:hypothetical protein